MNDRNAAVLDLAGGRLEDDVQAPIAALLTLLCRAVPPQTSASMVATTIVRIGPVEAGLSLARTDLNHLQAFGAAWCVPSTLLLLPAHRTGGPRLHTS